MRFHRTKILTYLLLVGSLSVPVSRAARAADISNGSFETGDLSGFSASGTGSVQVLSGQEFLPLAPTDGAYFALIGNGPGDQGGAPDMATLTSDPFQVSSGSTLTLNYDFLTAEFTGADPGQPGNPDSFEISLISASDPALLLASGDTRLKEFSNINSDGSPATAPDGTSVLEHLGYQNLSAPWLPASTPSSSASRMPWTTTSTRHSS